jgi:hypothetical protein
MSESLKAVAVSRWKASTPRPSSPRSRGSINDDRVPVRR